MRDFLPIYYYLLVEIRSGCCIGHFRFEKRPRPHFDVDNVWIGEAVQQVLHFNEAYTAKRKKEKRSYSNIHFRNHVVSERISTVSLSILLRAVPCFSSWKTWKTRPLLCGMCGNLTLLIGRFVPTGCPGKGTANNVQGDEKEKKNYFRLGSWSRGNTLEQYRWQSPSWAPGKQPVRCCQPLASSTRCPDWPEQMNRGGPTVEPKMSVDSSTERRWPVLTDPAHSTNHPNKRYNNHLSLDFLQPWLD